MKKFIFPLLILSWMPMFSQYGMIQDPDGFTNVRKAPDIQAEVIYQISEKEVFLYTQHQDSEWVHVYIPRDTFHQGPKAHIYSLTS